MLATTPDRRTRCVCFVANHEINLCDGPIALVEPAAVRVCENVVRGMEACSEM